MAAEPTKAKKYNKIPKADVPQVEISSHQVAPVVTTAAVATPPRAKSPPQPKSPPQVAPLQASNIRVLQPAWASGSLSGHPPWPTPLSSPSGSALHQQPAPVSPLQQASPQRQSLAASQPRTLVPCVEALMSRARTAEAQAATELGALGSNALRALDNDWNEWGDEWRNGRYGTRRRDDLVPASPSIVTNGAAAASSCAAVGGGFGGATAEDIELRRDVVGSYCGDRMRFDGDEPIDGRRRHLNWDDHISHKNSLLRVDLGGLELGDSDLERALAHVEEVMERLGGKTAMNIDISSNLYISDDGISTHLVSFLKKWPTCHRLKLFKTSVGDGALKALTPWIASGHARELHFSDLGGSVTGEIIYNLLKQVHIEGNYPYRNDDGGRCPLWFRLEHNAIQNPGTLVSQAKAQGMSVAVLNKQELGHVRPGDPGKNGKEVAAVNLVLFHTQELRVSRSWLESMVPMAPVSKELLEIVSGKCGGAAVIEARPRLPDVAAPAAAEAILADGTGSSTDVPPENEGEEGELSKITS